MNGLSHSDMGFANYINYGKAKITNKTQSFLIKLISYLQEE
jgi:hypothetical protein